MADKLIYIPNDETQKYPFCRLQLVNENEGDERRSGKENP